MQLLQGKPRICENKTIVQISVLSKWHLFSSSLLTVPAGADNPQTVVQSAADTDRDGWFDPLSYTRSRCCHQFFRAEKCINRRVLQILLKSPDEDKIHTNMHEHPTHTLGPWALNHEWDQTPTLCRNETSPEKNGIQCCIFNHVSCDFSWSADASSISVSLHVKLISWLWVPPVI